MQDVGCKMQDRIPGFQVQSLAPNGKRKTGAMKADPGGWVPKTAAISLH